MMIFATIKQLLMPGSILYIHENLNYDQISLLSPGWWFVSVGAEEGWAPCSYLEKLNGKEEEETISSLGK